MFYWKEFIDEINKVIKPNTIMLDAGAGDGHWKKHFPESIRYISMDMGVGDINVDYSSNEIKGDLKNIPLEDGSVDIIICIQVLEHLPEPWIVIKEFNRVLKSDGIIFMSLPHSVPIHQEPYDFYRYTKYGLSFLLNTNGFDIEFMRPQKGNASKIANDLRMCGNMLKNRNKVFIGNLYKVFAKLVDIILVPSEERLELYDNTTGYFLKARKV